MKNVSQSEILAELKLYPSQANKYYAGKLSKLFALVNELHKLDGFNVSLNGIKGNYEMVAGLPELLEHKFVTKFMYHEAKKQQNNCKDIFGEFGFWDTIEVKYKNGCYSFPFPTDNKFYSIFAGMAGIQIETEKQDKEILQTISFEATAFKAMATACKFISRDDLRPSMQYVCLSFVNNTLEVVATDAHRMYMSKKVNSSQVEKLQILISEKTAKELSKVKGKGEINILANGEIMVNGIVYSTFDGKFPDYKCVVPEYDEAMIFDRVKFIDNCKKVMPHANKSTMQITFHLNGTIAMHCEDVDFGMEADAVMPYISKDFKDTDIAFNGKLLTECLSTFKDKNIKMLSNGNAKHCGLFTNDIDTVLLMPLMLNEY